MPYLIAYIPSIDAVAANAQHDWHLPWLTTGFIYYLQSMGLIVIPTGGSLKLSFLHTFYSSTLVLGDFGGKHIWEQIETHRQCLILLGVVFCDIFQCLFEDCLAHLVLCDVLVGLPILSEILDECTVTTVLYQDHSWEWGTVKGEDHNCGRDTQYSQGGITSFDKVSKIPFNSLIATH